MQTMNIHHKAESVSLFIKKKKILEALEASYEIDNLIKLIQFVHIQYNLKPVNVEFLNKIYGQEINTMY